MRPLCVDCSRPVDVRRPGCFQEVSGWTEGRSAGGAHAVSLRKPTGRVMCKLCMDKRKLGISIDQSDLFS